MKKSVKYIIIIWSLLILGVLVYFNKDKLFNRADYISLGYSEISNKKIKELKLNSYLNKTYFKTLDAALESDDYINDYLQDYQKWLSLNLIDYAEPMNYTTNLTVFNRVYNSYMNNEYSDLIRMGISSVNEKVNVANEFSQMRIAMPNGYIIFSNSIYLTNKEFVTLLSLIRKEDNI